MGRLLERWSAGFSLNRAAYNAAFASGSCAHLRCTLGPGPYLRNFSSVALCGRRQLGNTAGIRNGKTASHASGREEKSGGRHQFAKTRGQVWGKWLKNVGRQ
jgi:hypothetical protein